MGSYHAKLFNNDKDRETKIFFHGLNGAGKTTVLYQLKLGEVTNIEGRYGTHIESIEHKQVSFVAWDVGGRDKVRPIIRLYYMNTDALVFVVDSTDHERLEQARDELMEILGDKELKNIFVAVLANKQDLPNAYSTPKIAEELQLHTVKKHKWCIFPTSATKGEGLNEALDWLSAQVEWSRTKHAVTEPVVQSVKEAQKAVQEVSKMKTTGWNHVVHAWKSMFSKCQS